jgi:RimJ/RimL family protein N-acetyltransferase
MDRVSDHGHPVDVPARLRVRPAEERDARAIASLHVAGWRAAYPGIVPASVLAALSEESYEQRWRRGLSSPLTQDRTFVAEEEDRITGVIATGLCRDDDQPEGTAEVFLLYVEPDLLGTGIDRELLRIAELDLADRGYSRAVLWVLRDNVRARRFYEIAAWTLEGKDQDLDMDGEAVNEVRYERDLDSGVSTSSR